jgi:hypothetical protein
MTQQPVAIVVAGVLIAGAIALTNHWAMDGNGPLLLNRWTGTVVICQAGYQPNVFELHCPPPTKQQ